MNQDKALLEALLQSSNLNSKQSLLQQRTNKNLNKSVIQHHINALINELIPLVRKEASNLGQNKVEGVKLFKKQNPNHAKKSMPPITVNLRVPNIKADAEFSEQLTFDRTVDGKVTFIYTDSIENFEGVTFDAENLILSGKSNQVGDHQFRLEGSLALPNGQTQKVIAILKITVVPDPRSLWKNIPSDETARFHKPDTHHEVIENSQVTLLASSVRGRSHAHKGIHRDDDFNLFCDNSSQWSISCVADGAGSCKYSRQGAFVAAKLATSTLKEALNGHYGVQLEDACKEHHANKSEETHKNLYAAYQHTMVKAAFEAVKGIRDCVDAEKGDTVKDFSTTLILAAHKKVEEGHLVVSFWVGDGGIVIYEKNKNVHLMGEPDSGEFAGQTRFLDNNIVTNSDVYNRVKMEIVESMDALILATDGITDAWFETEKQLDSLTHWDRLWAELEPHATNADRKEGIEGLTEWMDFWSRGNHDDRTISICLVKE